jgi:hypothetical protein
LAEKGHKVFGIPYVSQVLNHIDEKDITNILFDMTIEDLPKIDVVLEYRCPTHKNKIYIQTGFMDKTKRILVEDLYKKHFCEHCEEKINVPNDSIFVYFTIKDDYFYHVQYRMKNPLKL